MGHLNYDARMLDGTVSTVGISDIGQAGGDGAWGGGRAVSSVSWFTRALRAVGQVAARASPRRRGTGGRAGPASRHAPVGENVVARQLVGFAPMLPSTSGFDTRIGWVRGRVPVPPGVPSRDVAVKDPFAWTDRSRRRGHRPRGGCDGARVWGIRLSCSTARAPLKFKAGLSW